MTFDDYRATYCAGPDAGILDLVLELLAAQAAAEGLCPASADISAYWALAAAIPSADPVTERGKLAKLRATWSIRDMLALAPLTPASRVAQPPRPHIGTIVLVALAA